MLIGAHTSISGGLANAIKEGIFINATTIQIFTANQRRWSVPKIKEESLIDWKSSLKESNLKNIMSHSSYLINLGSNKEELLNKSRNAFKEEIERCQILGIDLLNFHPGSATNDKKSNCIERIIESLKSMADIVNNGNTKLVLENTAGQGSVIGSTFEEIAEIIEVVKNYFPIGVCMDTCHTFAAGYDISTGDSFKKTLKLFDDVIGIKFLSAMHLNDSMFGIASKRDRHANIGEGEIGIGTFKEIMVNKNLQDIPKYLETPGGLLQWKKEIEMLKNFRRDK